MPANTFTPVSECTSPKGPMGCKYHSRFVTADDIFKYSNLKDNETEKKKFFSSWFGPKEEAREEGYKMNKGEHSEALFSLRVLSGGFDNEVEGEEFNNPRLVFAPFEKRVWYKDDVLYIQEKRSRNSKEKVETRAYPAPNLKELADNMENEIKAGQGAFVCQSAAWYYQALSENGIAVKAPSLSKSDLFVEYNDADNNVKTAGISIKSKLGSPPSILNAAGRSTALSYEVSGYDDLSDEQLRSVLTKDVIANVNAGKSKVNFSDVSSEHFAGIMKEANLNEEAMANAVWKWKMGGGNKFSALTDEKDTPAFKQFFKIIMTSATPGSATRSKRPPAYMGHISKEGKVSLQPFENAWDNLIMDTPSTTRHDFGYLYREDGKVKMRIAVAARYN